MTTLAPLEMPTILLADDDPDLVALGSRRLSRAGYHVLTACNGEQALQMARDLLPELAVLDVMMPKLTGIDVMGQLRANRSTRHIRVILISASFRDNVIGRGLPAGAGDYIKKPFGPLELQNRVRAVLAR